MKIWLCGAKGMLGSHLNRLLQARQINFTATTREQVDITCFDKILDFTRKEKPTHIINCAAYTQVDKAETELNQAHKINSIGPGLLALVSQNFNIPLIHFSTDYVFDGKASQPYTEDHPTSPINHYGLTKQQGENALYRLANNSCLIRTSWLIGTPGKNFVETMLRQMLDKETLRVVSDQLGRPTFCQDLAEFTLTMLNQIGTYHFANSNETSWYAFAKEIHRQGLELGYPFKVKEIIPISTQEYPTPAKRPAYSTLSTAKIEKLLGRAPRPWQEALADHLRGK